MMPDAALLVPAYQAARYLPRLAAAARAQSQTFREWICYDDVSDDGTAEAATAAGFKVIKGDRNRGPSFARNRLAEAATSEWLHFHDADDLIAPDYLARALAAAGADDDVILCDSSWEFEHSRERIIHWRYRHEECTADPLAYVVSHPVGIISALIRRRVFLDSGGFDESMTCWEDADLFVRLAEHGARFRCIEQTLVTSLRHDRGVSRNQHHCDRCRLEFLRGYASRFPARLHLTLAAEAEKLLPRFLAHGDGGSAREALRLCCSLGGNPPTTANPALRLLKPFAPALWLVRLQHRHRTIAAERP
jgi:glycosyltransferase involved in cell wall biosynthesis